jgi:DNA-directed RNA polymerase beta subunit
VADRFNLTHRDNALHGNVTARALRQLMGEVPIYEDQLANPQDYGPTAFAKAASTYVPIGVPKPMPKAPMKSPMAHHRYLADDDEHEKYAPVGIDGLLAATEKLLAVNRGLAETDDRDSLPNDRVHTVDRLMAERIKLDHGHALRAMMGRLSRMRTLDPVGPDAFGGYTMGYLKSNPLVTALEEINPMHILEQKRRITKMGPGGIGDPNAITDDMTAVSATQFGFVDPIAGPESEKAGIDVRLAHGARVGSDGRIYQLLVNRRTGKKEWVSPSNLRGKTLKLPD